MSEFSETSEFNAPSNAPFQGGAGLDALWSPTSASTALIRIENLSEALVQAGVATAEQVNSAESLMAKTPGRSLPSIFHDLGLDEEQLQLIVARITNWEFERINYEDYSGHKYLEALGFDYCEDRGLLPLRKSGNRVVVGFVDPDDLTLVDEVRHRIKAMVKPVVVTRADIFAVLENIRDADGDDREDDVSQIINDMDDDDVEVVQDKDEDIDLEKAAEESPVIRLVNYIIANAVKEGASDIHIEPMEKKLQVRYRIDGVLFDAMSPPFNMKNAISSRLKIMANLDISERRLPQDGRIRCVIHGRKLDLRLSTLPVAAGEKAVMRILDTRSIQVDLDDLGFGPDMLTIWKNQIANPHGIILVTGPTGSGKTTTLYSSLNQMDRQKLNISTVEDPIEYHLNGVNQTQTHEKIGMSFAAALRALLRQDPDVVMVGEIRDMETAKIAIQASLTGHLVLSTLHTNDAPSSVTRLINIGVEPFLIGSAVNATLAQRLVRRICKECKEPKAIDDQHVDMLEAHGISADSIFHGTGCDSCRGTGYAGRVGLYELLVLDDFLRDRISGNPNVTEFRRICVERGMTTLRQDGFAKVAAGNTTIEEILRVTEAAS